MKHSRTYLLLSVLAVLCGTSFTVWRLERAQSKPFASSQPEVAEGRQAIAAADARCAEYQTATPSEPEHELRHFTQKGEADAKAAPMAVSSRPFFADGQPYFLSNRDDNFVFAATDPARPQALPLWKLNERGEIDGAFSQTLRSWLSVAGEGALEWRGDSFLLSGKFMEALHCDGPRETHSVEELPATVGIHSDGTRDDTVAASPSVPLHQLNGWKLHIPLPSLGLEAYLYDIEHEHKRDTASAENFDAKLERTFALYDADGESPLQAPLAAALAKTNAVPVDFRASPGGVLLVGIQPTDLKADGPDFPDVLVFHPKTSEFETVHIAVTGFPTLDHLARLPDGSWLAIVPKPASR